MAKETISGWEKLSAVATLVQAIVVIISISFIKSQLSLQTDQLNLQTDQLKVQNDQLQQQTDLARAANIQTLTALSLPLNLEEVKSAETVKLLFKGKDGFRKGVDITDLDIKKEQYKTMMANWLIFYENIHYQNSKGLIDPEMNAAWNKDLEGFIVRYGLWNFWDEMKDAYHESFRNHIDQLIKRNQPQQR
jgi:cell division protein FtsL